MKPNWLNIGVGVVILLAYLGCDTDVTRNPGSITDFIAGQSYEIVQPVFIFSDDRNDPSQFLVLDPLGLAGTPKDLASFKAEMASNTQIAGLLSPGDQVRVKRIVKSSIPGLTKVVNISAIVTSGNCKGKAVELYMLTKEGAPAPTAFVDPKYLVPAN